MHLLAPHWSIEGYNLCFLFKIRSLLSLHIDAFRWRETFKGDKTTLGPLWKQLLKDFDGKLNDEAE